MGSRGGVKGVNGARKDINMFNRSTLCRVGDGRHGKDRQGAATFRDIVVSEQPPRRTVPLPS